MERRQGNGPAARPLAAALAPALLWVACASAPANPAPDLSNSAEAAALEAALESRPATAAPGTVVVRLAFGAGSDLDLFVSDPRSETIYFANKRAASGGRLAEDLRCDAPAPRIEIVRFEPALPGRYRIGIDHPGVCGEKAAPAIFVVEWSTRGQTHRLRGSVAPLVFDSIVQEFDLPPPHVD
jgi:hypothetical protein